MGAHCQKVHRDDEPRPDHPGRRKPANLGEIPEALPLWGRAEQPGSCIRNDWTERRALGVTTPRRKKNPDAKEASALNTFSVSRGPSRCVNSSIAFAFGQGDLRPSAPPPFVSPAAAPAIHRHAVEAVGPGSVETQRPWPRRDDLTAGSPARASPSSWHEDAAGRGLLRRRKGQYVPAEIWRQMS